MSDAAKQGTSSAITDEAELDRLANELNMDGLDDDEDDEDTEEFTSLASELMQESASAAPSNGVPANGATARPSVPMRSSTSAPAVSALGSFMNRARTSGFAGLRFGPGGVTGPSRTGGPGSRDAFDVLGVREGARWRLILAQDATGPAPTRPLSRSYMCQRGRVRPLDAQLATSLGVEAMRSSCANAKIAGEELNELVKLAEKMGNVLLPEIERAIGSRLAVDPDFDKDRFPKAAARFQT